MTARNLAKPLLLAVLISGSAHADYFLSGGQKLDLIEHGEMNGEDGARYDVWIVPGYTGPAHDAKTGWVSAGHDFAEYGHGDLYKDAFGTGKSAFSFATKDTIGHFAFKGSYDAWGNAMSAASERTEKRVFGWWFAYPWAVIEATGESVVRVGLGVPGGIVIGGLGTTVAPVAELAWPTVKGIYHSTIPGTVLPIAAGGWNTVISPPMALLGQQPNEERADGFWLKRIDPEQTDPELIAARAALSDWRNTLVATPEAQSVSDQKKALREDYDKKRDAMLKQLRHQYEADQAQLDAQWQQTIEQQAALHQPELDAHVDPHKLTALVQRYGRDSVIQSLSGSGLTRDQANALLTQLVGADTGSSAPKPAEQRQTDDKTDPLKRSLQLGTQGL